MMPAAPDRRDPHPRRSPLTRLLHAGLLCGVVDGLWAVVLTWIYGRTFLQLWQGVASVPFGREVMDRGWTGALLGLAVHFGVAFGWSALFLALVLGSAWLRRVLATWRGVVAVAAVYGPAIWIVMSAVVIPFLIERPLTVTYRWWIQLAGHVVFVGLPIVGAISRDEPRA